MFQSIAFAFLAVGFAQAAVIPKNERVDTGNPWFPKPGVDPFTLANKDEGDMVLDTNTEDATNNTKRSAVFLSKIWPDGTVYYKLGNEYSKVEIDVIESAFREMELQTMTNGIHCIRFVERKDEPDYIYIFNDSGCYSKVGRTGGEQLLSLGYGCVGKGVIMHELKHALGFYHEHTRIDRDRYITINWNAIKPGKERHFLKVERGTSQHLTPYDYSSIMHYGSWFFTRGTEQTIIPKDPDAVIGQRLYLSDYDIMDIRKLYSCGIYM